MADEKVLSGPGDQSETELRELIADMRAIASRLPFPRSAIAVALEEAADEVDELLAEPPARTDQK